MTDKELLKLAAKAAGIDARWGQSYLSGRMFVSPSNSEGLHGREWHPLTDDGDALRLAVKLNLDVCFGANYVIVRGSVQMPTVNNADDPYAATRRAIVRAAAEIGKSMTTEKTR